MTKKSVFILAAGILLLACGDGNNASNRPVRTAAAGTSFEGPAGGRDRYLFKEGDSLNFIVSGTMRLTVPDGIFKGSAFPADVTYSVKSTNGGLITGSVSFPRLLIDRNGLFQGAVSNETSTATITGVYQADVSTSTIDVQGFSARIPTTDTTILERTLILQGQLRERLFQNQ
jgi:hypothetical protein